MLFRYRRLISYLVVVSSICYFTSVFSFAQDFDIGDSIPSAIIMEKTTGLVLYEKDADSPRSPASVTKVMTALLIMEAIDSGKIGYDDIVTVSSYASSMGGSQVYLKEGEQMSVSDMLKSIVVASANDACVAMAEHIAGSEEAFVSMMNEKASELGMANTHFENTNGLDDTAQNHYTTARDIAIMSRELLNHEKILDFSSIWMDSIRGGEFGLTNTNRLIRFYKGANGLKTGSTSKAGFCISATAERDGMTLICVIMGAPSRDERNEAAKCAFDYGFANYALYNSDRLFIDAFPVKRGESDVCTLSSETVSFLYPKGSAEKITSDTVLPEYLNAPVHKGDSVGKVVYFLDGEEVGESSVTADDDVKEVGFGYLLLFIIRKLFAI